MTRLFIVLFFNIIISSPTFAEEYKTEDYRYGNNWSRRAIKKTDIKNNIIKSAVVSSVEINGASGIYVGKFNGVHLIATANHVINYPGCDLLALGGFRASNGLSNSLSGCLATFPELDLAIITFDLDDPTNESKLKAFSRNFAFDEIPQEGEELVFVGHGIAGNPKQKLMLGMDDDCRVVSKTGETRLLDDPDKINPNGYASWQIADACDVSHGDSGAGLFSRKTGKLLSLISTGTFPVDRRFQNSSLLHEQLKKDPELAWTMNLSVPAFKMREVIQKRIMERQFDQETVKTLEAFLRNHID